MIDYTAVFVFLVCATLLFAGIGKCYQLKSKIFIVSLFILKCICGYALLLYYAGHGGGDMIGYIKESALLLEAIKHQPDLLLHLFHRTVPESLQHLELWNNAHYTGVYSDNRIFLLYLSFVRLFTGGSIVSAIVITNFLALCGLVKLSEFGMWILSPTERVFRFWLFLMPTILVWTSGLFKESILLFPLGYLLLSLKMKGLKSALQFAACLFLSVLIKPYIIAVLLPGIAAFFLLKKYSALSVRRVFFFVYVGGLIDVLIIGLFITALNLPEYLFGQQLNLLRNGVYSKASTLVGAVHFAPTMISFLKHLPIAICYASMRPLPFEQSWYWSIPFGLESIAVVLYALFIFKESKRKSFSSEQWLLMYAGLTLLMLLGFTIPVLGNLVRLRMPAVLFLMLAFSGLNQANSKQSLQDKI